MIAADKFCTVGLLDEQEKVVSKHILPIVVRETCLAIRTSSLLEQKPKFRPKSRRQNQIDSIVAEHASKDSGNAYFNCFCKDHWVISNVSKHDLFGVSWIIIYDI